MTDAERLAKEYIEGQDMEWGDPMLWGNTIAGMQRLIDSGVVTVNPPPDPAEQLRVVWNEMTDSYAVRFRRLIDDEWITPGPRCDQ